MFKKAYPIFAANKEYEMNTHLTLRADLASLKNAKLRIAVSSFYQLFVNDRFVAFGPCRAAGGYARVDEFLLMIIITKMAIPFALRRSVMLAVRFLRYTDRPSSARRFCAAMTSLLLRERILTAIFLHIMSKRPSVIRDNDISRRSMTRVRTRRSPMPTA